MNHINQKITFRELVINPQFRKYSGLSGRLDPLFDGYKALKEIFNMNWSEIEQMFYQKMTE